MIRRSIVAEQKKSDPTLTLTLRNKFVSAFARRFNWINTLSDYSIVDNDAFGLTPVTMPKFISAADDRYKRTTAPLHKDALRQETTTGKIEGYEDWLEETTNATIFQDISGAPSTEDKPTTYRTLWATVFISTAYKKGISWARQKLKQDPVVRKALGLSLEDVSTASHAITSSYNMAQHQRKIEALFLRTFTDLEGITSAQAAAVLRVLNEGLSQGKSASEISKMISGRISSIGKHRATLLARTEIIRAHHIATIEEYRNYGLEYGKVQAEWSTAGDSRVCPICKPKDGKIYSLDEIEGMIPVHPQCRCAALPYIPDGKL